ncbi:T9SS type A sorting domain-containing protein [Hymenobacter ruricola]|uniref:T9SS type A sorting domain-containing protein n=1 Tax=Hymenobacter ruricola TaxID=2791023 RepID=A0ABS0I450_9BACT|nr:T9SS type A sorting domain-containing protein [Hymenobacter ruricola]MBF9221689.1 T9SS type A sorting domain-containing protein [Hymenobacter ruricola]
MKHVSSLMRRGPVAALLLILSWLAGPAARAQAPAWQAATAFAPTNAATYSSLVKATATDAAGNVYMAGYFTGTATFGAVTLTSAGNTDVFIAKWNPRTAALAWVQRAGGPGVDGVSGIAVSGSSVYVAGYFTGTAGFGGTTLTSMGGGNSDAFVAKLADAGSASTWAWVQPIGSTAADQATAVAVSGSSVYATGYFAGTVAFGGTTLTSAPGSAADAFVAKLTDAGSSASFAWAQRGSTGLTYGFIYGVAVRGGSVYLTGYFTGTASFGPVGLASAGSGDVFVVKLTDAGATSSFTWGLAAGGISNDYAFTVVPGAGSSLYIVGRFDSPTAGFGATTLTNVTAASPTMPDVFVAKITDAGPTGAFTWAQAAGGPGVDIGVGLAVSGPNVYVVGHFQGTAAFGGAALTSVSTSNSDVFVTKLVDAGPTSAFAWTQSGGGSGADFGYALALAGSSVYAVGSFVAPATFGSIAVTGSFGGSVAYLASLTDPTLLATTAAQGSLSFSLAPNPAHTTATVTLPALPGAPTATLALLDALGRAVFVQTVPLPAAGLRHELDLRGLAPGLYALRVTTGAETATRRLVVE